MLPNSSPVPTPSIHINPRFRNVHINPSFLSKSNAINGKPMESPVTVTAPTQIYINPRFLANPSMQGITQTTISAPIQIDETFSPYNITAQEFHETNTLVAEPLADTKIHTRTKIIKPSLVHKIVDLPPKNIENSTMHGKMNGDTKKSLIKIGSNKLVRVSAKPFDKMTTEKAVSTVRRPLQTKYKIIKEQTAFKIDRRSVKAKRASITQKVTPFISSLMKKQLINELLTPTKLIKGNTINRSLVKATTNLPSVTAHRKLSSFLEINGILYKSNQRKLEKTTLSTKYSLQKPTKTQLSYRRLIVRGENFLLDANGKNLVRVQSNGNNMVNDTVANRKRIDIGKITFVKKSNDTYERTDFHKSRYHLNVAKQRSIQMLTNLVKTNVPCPIYRKLGKCAAFVRGKCTKLHDKKLIDVCPRFIRGTCDKDPCLLSHNTTLSKMPTCKFYLLGMCSKTDCPYLHKKVNDKAGICVDFVRGFCEKAQECSKRHEFLCAEYQRKGSCKLTRCPYPHPILKESYRSSKQKSAERLKLKRKLKTVEKKPNIPHDIEKTTVQRYFVKDSNDENNQNNSETSSGSVSANANKNVSTENVEQIHYVRKPIVGSLPSFIPIG
ncbi:zinc finger CCCH domain-containing protein 3 [Contarinia nasturtii]|uniref:zinc finger CCCH domain-containing protein 3 n=1 Tax=Contarinia nasturtii TaxID=265458 RepID=UPI0012D3B9E5|nr:zinc finger CCCH domain-containing protein 3 [Contarinia nasturtii]